MKKNKAIILLSGGLDSYIAFDIASFDCDIVLALNFDYGQKAFKEENESAQKIANLYAVKLKTLKLPYLSELCDNALTNFNKNNLDELEGVWVANRNGLFVNIAACFCDKYGINNIILGLNKEEAQNFSDNSAKFIEASNSALFYSTQVHPEVVAPCINMTKTDMINYAVDNNLDLNLIKSCYDSNLNTQKKHCGVCMSCRLLYNAIINSKKPELIKELF